MDRTRRLSEQILSRHPEAFGEDFEKNKKALEDLAIIPSKQLRNRIAGYIAKSLMEDSEEEDAEKGEESLMEDSEEEDAEKGEESPE